MMSLPPTHRHAPISRISAFSGTKHHSKSPHRSRWKNEKYTVVGKKEWPVGSQNRKRERFVEKTLKLRGFDGETASLLMKEFPDGISASSSTKQDSIDSDTSTGSGKDAAASGPIARSLYQAAKQRARRTLPDGTRAFPGDHVVVNGHAELSELIATVKNSATIVHQSPLTPLHRRHRQRVNLELAKPQLPVRASVAAPDYQLDQQAQQDRTGGRAGGEHDVRGDAKENDEHQLIACCSALLQVSPPDASAIESAGSKLTTHDADVKQNHTSSTALSERSVLGGSSMQDSSTSGSTHTVVVATEASMLPCSKEKPPIDEHNCVIAALPERPTEPDQRPSTSGSGASSIAPRPLVDGQPLCPPPVHDIYGRVRNRQCTSFRVRLPMLKNPVDACLLPNDYVTIADYDNGFFVVDGFGDIVEHKHTANEQNACGVACTQADVRLYVLLFKEGLWSINVYDHCSEFVHTIRCPTEANIESWALRTITIAPDTGVYLMASGEASVAIWAYELPRRNAHVERALNGHDTASETASAASGSVSTGTGPPSSALTDTGISLAPTDIATSVANSQTEGSTTQNTTHAQSPSPWKLLLAENSRKGGYNDLSVKYNAETKETTLLLCDLRKSMLSTIVLDDKYATVDQRSIRVRRAKGQEWVVQGPNLAVLDEQSDIIVYDGSGKLFLFDGETYKCKKIIADIGRGEVSSISVRNGWVYVLCRYRLTLEVYLYKEFSETTL